MYVPCIVPEITRKAVVQTNEPGMDEKPTEAGNPSAEFCRYNMGIRYTGKGSISGNGMRAALRPAALSYITGRRGLFSRASCILIICRRFPMFSARWNPRNAHCRQSFSPGLAPVGITGGTGRFLPLIWTMPGICRQWVFFRILTARCSTG